MKTEERGSNEKDSEGTGEGTVPAFREDKSLCKAEITKCLLF